MGAGAVEGVEVWGGGKGKAEVISEGKAAEEAGAKVVVGGVFLF